jgi:hypothetical protein
MILELLPVQQVATPTTHLFASGLRSFRHFLQRCAADMLYSGPPAPPLCTTEAPPSTTPALHRTPDPTAFHTPPPTRCCYPASASPPKRPALQACTLPVPSRCWRSWCSMSSTSQRVPSGSIQDCSALKKAPSFEHTIEDELPAGGPYSPCLPYCSVSIHWCSTFHPTTSSCHCHCSCRLATRRSSKIHQFLHHASREDAPPVPHPGF